MADQERQGQQPSRAARCLLGLVVAVHLALLLLSLRDYWPDNDLGYHISLARQYALHGTYFWDHLNWAPTGRPNLQGPLLHFSIGMLGRILGGTGDDYVLAFSLLAILQWAAAVFTAVFFARRHAGDWAALIAAALLTGSIYSAGSFFVGVPSGWIFILTPWAVHFFLQDRALLASLCTTLVIYVHLGGASTAPFGIFLAAVFTRRWRGLAIVAGATAVLTAPYTIHFLRHLDWYTGRRGHVAGSAAFLIYVLCLPGLVWLLRRPRENLFLLVWAIAPLAWLYQDSLRFFLQSTIAGAAIGAIFTARLLRRLEGRVVRGAVVGGLIMLATFFPLSLPSLPIELAWAAGMGFPRELDWKEARTLARVFEGAKFNGRIVNSYYDSLSAAMAVYTDLRQEYGHWGEVRPRVNPAAGISAGEKVYVLPLPPEDPKLADVAAAGLAQVHGGSAATSIVTLARRGNPAEISPMVADILHAEGTWLARHAVNNRLPPVRVLLSTDALAAWREGMAAQKVHPGRIQLAYLVYAYAQEEAHPELAAAVRRGARNWGGIANFIGDETAIDYLSESRFQRFKENAARFAEAALVLRRQSEPTPELDAVSTQLFDDFF